MKKRTLTHRRGIGLFFRCPFCKHLQAYNENMPWCGKCFVEYDLVVKKKTWVESDDEKRTPRFAWAKAIGRTGGVDLGKVVKIERGQDE